MPVRFHKLKAQKPKSQSLVKNKFSSSASKIDKEFLIACLPQYFSSMDGVSHTICKSILINRVREHYVCLLTFQSYKFFKKFSQEHYQSVKRFDPAGSQPTFFRSRSGSKLFATIISR